MSGAQNWSVRGIDPKVREAAREEAARRGMSLGEYLNQALQKHQTPAQTAASTQPRFRSARLGPHPYDEEDEDWNVGAGAASFARSGGGDASRLSQRIEAIERRTQLAVTGLDRAVSTIDRSVLGLAARIEFAENVSRESSDRIAEALEHFRIAGDTLGGRLEQAENAVNESRNAFAAAKTELTVARERLEAQVAAAEEIARKAEAAAHFLTTELSNQDAAIGHRLGALEDRTHDALSRMLTDARNAAIEAGRQASQASIEAMAELKALQADIARRLEENESATQRAIEEARSAKSALSGEIARLEARLGAQTAGDHAAASARLAAQTADAEQAIRRAADAAVAEARSAHERLTREIARLEAPGADSSQLSALQSAVESSTRAAEDVRAAQARLEDRLTWAENETRGLRQTVIDEVVRIESEIGERLGAADALKAEHNALIARIEKAEHGARESTAGLRQAAGAAIADLRNAQLGLAARLKQVEDAAGRTGALDLAELRAQQSDIALRLANLESRPQPRADGALADFERRLDEISSRVDQRPAADSPVDSALAAFEKRLEEIAAQVGQGAAQEKLEEVGGAVKTLDESLQRLTQRIAETETTANSAIRTLEETVSSLSARVDATGAAQETEALRALLEQRLDEMTQSVTHMVGEARSELADQVQAALNGQEALGLEAALEDTNRRLAAAERRQAQTIEAISIEIKRMSESVDRRLSAIEGRSDEGASTAVREELSRMGTALEKRFEDIERREAAAFDRMGLEIGRLSERLEERVGAVEGRSAQAIEHVGEQVARMAERFNQRHELLARELGERMLDSEERTGARVNEAINSMMQRLGEVEERSAEAVAPVQKAVSSIASRLEGLEKEEAEMPTPARRADDYSASPFASDVYTPPMPTPAPMPSSPLRAGPLPPMTSFSPPAVEESDIYFAEDIDLIAEDAPVEPPTAPAATPIAESTPYIAIEADDVDAFDDPFLEETEAFAPPPPEDDDPFWTPEDGATAEAAPEAELTQSFMPDAPSDATADSIDDALVEPPPPPGKNDYLNTARRAAQAQAAEAKKPKKGKDKATDSAYAASNLRGSSRIVLWGAASAMALLIAGGAWYLNARGEAEAPAPTPEPDAATEPAPTTGALDGASAAPSEAEALTEPAAPTDGSAPAATPSEAPVAQAAPAATPVVAGPLSPRATSLEQAAQGGDLVAQYELGLQRISGGRTEEGVSLLRRAADRGMAMAQYRLAKLYERGEGVPADLTAARQWTERAAAGGNRRAMHDLGVYFARGEGATMDEAAAFRWFRQAAELGVADSQFNLGVLYQQGRGVNASAAEAMFWFLVAARQGDEDAATRATALEAQLAPIQVEQARARAQAFRPRAASAPANGEFGPRAWNTAARAGT